MYDIIEFKTIINKLTSRNNNFEMPFAVGIFKFVLLISQLHLRNSIVASFILFNEYNMAM